MHSTKMFFVQLIWSNVEQLEQNQKWAHFCCIWTGNSGTIVFQFIQTPSSRSEYVKNVICRFIPLQPITMVLRVGSSNTHPTCYVVDVLYPAKPGQLNYTLYVDDYKLLIALTSARQLKLNKLHNSHVSYAKCHTLLQAKNSVCYIDWPLSPTQPSQWLAWQLVMPARTSNAIHHSCTDFLSFVIFIKLL